MARTTLPPHVSPRGLVRGAFLVFFVFLCAKLWLFALWALGRSTAEVTRPDAVAGIIPVGAFTSFFAWVKTGVFDPVVPAGVVIVVAALLLSVLLKRGFCGWICPVGSVFEASSWAGRKLRSFVPWLPRWFGRHAPIPVLADRVLRGIRYALTGMVVLFVAMVSAEEALSFQHIPYYAAADVKILSYFVSPPLWYFLFGVGVVAASATFGNVWCRYLCPLGGLYGAVGTASACTVVRDDEVCTSCRKCSRVCHAGVRVDNAGSVRAPECDGCMDCVIACPEDGALTARVFGSLRMPWWAWPAAVVGVWLAVYIVALATGHWHSTLPASYFADAIRTLGL